MNRNPFLGRVMVFPRAVADKDVRPSDLESANLVLFGTKETNRFSDRLPLHLDPAATDYGLAYVFPVGERYVLVSSGLAWWESTPEADGAGARRAWSFMGGAPASMLTGLPDYVLFKGSIDQVVAEGRFGPDWRLAAPDAQRLKAAGVVTLGSKTPTRRTD